MLTCGVKHETLQLSLSCWSFPHTVVWFDTTAEAWAWNVSPAGHWTVGRAVTGPVVDPGVTFENVCGPPITFPAASTRLTVMSSAIAGLEFVFVAVPLMVTGVPGHAPCVDGVQAADTVATPRQR